MVALCTALTLLAAAQADAPFPLRAGARWTYAQDGKPVMILDAVELSKVDRQDTVTVRVRGGSFFWHHDDAFFSVGKAGLRLHGGTYLETVFPEKPPSVVLPPELEKGRTWTGNKLEATVLDQEEITVAAGTFKAWKIEYLMRNHLGTENDFRAWFAPGTGFVRLEYFQESTRGDKTPLAKPYHVDLVRFEKERKPAPVPYPPLSDADRRAAEVLIDRKADAEAFLALGRGVIPLIREKLGKDAPVLALFPRLEFETRLAKPRGRVGEPLPLRFVLRNLSEEPLRIVPALDDSDTLRSPRYFLTVRDEEGTEQKPKELPICATVNPLLARDFVVLEPGGEFDPLGPGTFGHYMLSWVPGRAGTYTVDAAYDATGKVPDAWKGSVKTMNRKALSLLESMPRGRYVAPQVTIVVDP